MFKKILLALDNSRTDQAMFRISLSWLGEDLLYGSTITQVRHRANAPVLLVNAPKWERLALPRFSVILRLAARPRTSQLQSSAPSNEETKIAIARSLSALRRIGMTKQKPDCDESSMPCWPGTIGETN
jgi:hypothetical protein